MPLDKYKQAVRVIRHILWLVDQGGFYGTLEIQFTDSVPTYTRRIIGNRVDELSGLADPVRTEVLINQMARRPEVPGAA